MGKLVVVYGMDGELEEALDLLPQLTALVAFRLVQSSRQSDVPFVIVSGSIGEERAVQALKDGVANFVMKGNLPHLVQVVERELTALLTSSKRDPKSQASLVLDKVVAEMKSRLSARAHKETQRRKNARTQRNGVPRVLRSSS